MFTTTHADAHAIKNKMPTFIVNNAAIYFRPVSVTSVSTIDASRLRTTVTLMLRVYCSVLWFIVSNVSMFIFNNTTENNTFINIINVKNKNMYK